VLCGCAAWPAPASPAADAAPISPPLRVRIDDASLVIPPTSVQAAADTPADRAITIRGAAGSRTSEVGGTSIGALLSALGIPLDGLSGIEIQSGSGRAVRLTADEVRDGFSGDPGCPNCKATLDIDARRGTMHFVRPLRSAADTNADDELAPGKGQTLYVRVRSERAGLSVNISQPDGSTTRTGRTHRFDTELFGAREPQVTWFFGDGATSTGPTATHAYEAAGAWPASVLVVAGGRFGADTEVVRVRRSRSEPQAKDPAVALTPTPTATPTGGAATPAPGAVATGAPAPAATLPPAPLPTSPPDAPTPAPAPDETPPPLVPPPPGATQSIRGRLASATPEQAALAGALTAAEALAAQPDRDDAPTPPADRGRAAVAAGSAVSGMLLVGLLSAGALTERRRARRATDLLR
jgi:hypothetical protein